eukprot:TRINITY_DN3737_c0_g1_i5.p1 TRINITY_DN3737_c0_g1~~TRINITY_DN3737_c0_g1_i5.p1  ORF type:complete len:215 (-),score=16.76 TRINITY_DN3737_c0_g1_i5:156-800(-)
MASLEQKPIPNWKEIYTHTERPLHLDLGTGTGENLIVMSLSRPEWNYLGMELRPLVVEDFQRLKERYESENNVRLSNIHLAHANALNHARLFIQSLPQGALQSISILFPDPWTGQRESKRRLVNRHFITELASVTKQGVELFLMTDVLELFGLMLPEVLSSGYFSAQEHDHPPDWERFMTSRLFHYKAQHRPVYRVKCTRTDKEVPLPAITHTN